MARTTRVEDWRPTAPAVAMMTGRNAASSAIFSNVATKTLEITRATTSPSSTVVATHAKRSPKRLSTESRARLMDSPPTPAMA